VNTAYHISELLGYLIVGGLVTLADMFVYNALTGSPLRLPRVLANTVSVTVGMLLGFTFHFIFVFHPGDPQIPLRAAKYVVTVAVSVYGVQNLVIFLLTEFWRVPVSVTHLATRTFHLASAYAGDFVDRTIGKVAAAVTGMAWNYVVFKFFVYA